MGEIMKVCPTCQTATSHVRNAEGQELCVPCLERIARGPAASTASAPMVGGYAPFQCATCARVTMHTFDSLGRWGCNECAARAAGAAQAVRAEHRRRGGVSNTRRTIGALVFLSLVFVGSGFFHCVHGGDITVVKVVPKEEWGFYDQFVDLDEIIGTPLITQVGRARTIRALIREGLIARPDFGRDEDR